MNVLVAYGSKHGATKGIAEHIAERLRAEQRQAEHELDGEEPVCEPLVHAPAALRGRLDIAIAHGRGARAAADEKAASIGGIVAGHVRALSRRLESALPQRCRS